MQWPEVRHGGAKIAQGTVHFVERGRGPALVLVHGGHGSWTHWVANIEALAHQRRVIALDLPGFGASFNPRPHFSVEQYAASVRDVMNALRIDHAAVAGFSFGCLVSAALARAEPSRITHLVTVNSPGIGPASPLAVSITQALSALTVRTGLRNGALESLRQLQLYNTALIDDDLVELMMSNVKATRYVSRKFSRFANNAEVLREVRQPTLILIGREDIYRQHGLEEALRTIPEVSPRAAIHIVENARHWLQFDRATLFNQLVDEFIR
jgi:pimeloyl-ACP methyl ester carboxylesterase